jgi:large subunit ribosomal protein L10
MSLKIKDKKQVVVELACYAHLSSSAVVASCNGLSVNQVRVLRKKMHFLGAYLKVVRNTLLKIAIVDTKFGSMRKFLHGSLTIIFSPVDPIVLAKAVNEFMIKHDKFKVKNFSMFGRTYGVNKIQQLSLYPSLEGSIILLCNILLAVISTVVRTLNEIPARSIRILSIIAGK